MAGKTKYRDRGWVVRLVLHPGPEGARDQRWRNCTVSTFVEQMRYMGVLAVLEDSIERLVVDIAPDDKQTRDWAEMHATRMRSFGLNAVAAPKYA